MLTFYPEYPHMFSAMLLEAVPGQAGRHAAMHVQEPSYRSNKLSKE